MASIGLLVIATNRYVKFVPSLLDSVRRHFLHGHEVTVFLFTDMNAPEGVVRIPHKHKPWPNPTLMRYHAFANESSLLSQMDYLFYCDVDMRFVDDVGEEILGALVATRHPNFFNTPPEVCTYERRPQSTACVPMDAGRAYYAGGFQGGRSAEFLHMARTLSAQIDADLEEGLVAVWHDESHLNRYLTEHPPLVELSPAYCYPEGEDLPFHPKLIALKKDHAWYRDSLIKRLFGPAQAFGRHALRRCRWRK